MKFHLPILFSDDEHVGQLSIDEPEPSAVSSTMLAQNPENGETLESVLSEMTSSEEAPSMVSNEIAMESDGEQPGSADVPMIVAPQEAISLESVQPASTPPKVASTQAATEEPVMTSSMSSNSVMVSIGIDGVMLPPKSAVVQRKVAFEVPPQGTNERESKKSCVACNKVLSGGLTMESNGVVQYVCNTACLIRAKQVPQDKSDAASGPVAASTDFRRVKQCFVCKNTITDPVAVVDAKHGKTVYSFCGHDCFSRVAQTQPRFYCEVCDRPYKEKSSLKRHFGITHPGEIFNKNIVAQVRSNQ